MLEACQESAFCRSTPLHEAIDELCELGHIDEMSLRAAEQFVCILGVMTMCSVLYIALCLMERCFVFVLGTGKNKSKHR